MSNTTHELAPEEQLILLAHRLRATREKKGFTQAKLAKKVGTHVNSIAEYEKGNRPPSLLVLLTICRELGTSICELLDETLPD